MLTDRAITCPQCLARLAEAPKTESGFALAREMFEVGNPARPEMGHARYFTSDGRVALCSATRKEPPCEPSE